MSLAEALYWLDMPVPPEFSDGQRAKLDEMYTKLNDLRAGGLVDHSADVSWMVYAVVDVRKRHWQIFGV